MNSARPTGRVNPRHCTRRRRVQRHDRPKASARALVPHARVLRRDSHRGSPLQASRSRFLHSITLPSGFGVACFLRPTVTLSLRPTAAARFPGRVVAFPGLNVRCPPSLLRSARAGAFCGAWAPCGLGSPRASCGGARLCAVLTMAGSSLRTPPSLPSPRSRSPLSCDRPIRRVSSQICLLSTMTGRTRLTGHAPP